MRTIKPMRIPQEMDFVVRDVSTQTNTSKKQMNER
jgi:hypothetical protein